MEIRRSELQRELTALAREIDVQIEQVKREALIEGIAPEKFRDSQGNWVMLPLILAKANVLLALVELGRPREMR